VYAGKAIHSTKGAGRKERTTGHRADRLKHYTANDIDRKRLIIRECDTRHTTPGIAVTTLHSLIHSLRGTKLQFNVQQTIQLSKIKY
jgi:hypothetical protein